MGCGYSAKCLCKENRDISYGVGMLFDEVECKIRNDIILGKYGEDLKSLYESNSDLPVIADLTVFKCTNCEYWENSYSISNKMKHICPKCNSAMVEINERNIQDASLICPDCKGKITIGNMDILWD